MRYAKILLAAMLIAIITTSAHAWSWPWESSTTEKVADAAKSGLIDTVGTSIAGLEADVKTLAASITSQQECVEGRMAAYYFGLNLSSETKASVRRVLAQSDSCSVMDQGDGTTTLTLKTKDKWTADFKTCYTAVTMVIAARDIVGDVVDKNATLIDTAITGIVKLVK